MTMPIITRMIIFGYSKNGETILEPTETCLCPKCKQGVLNTRSRVRRHSRKEETGEKVWFLVPVGKCKSLEQQGQKYPGKTVYLPSAQTIRRWAVWLTTNKERIEGLFRSVGYRVLNFNDELLFSTASLLEKLRRDTGHWLQVTIRFIYNSGCHLQSA